MPPLDIDESLARASTLHKRFYFDPVFLELEKRAVFRRSWQPLGRADQVTKPGDYFAANLADEPVVVVRGENQEVRALSNVCRHRAALIREGAGNAKNLQCPYHAWTYRLDGSLLAAPEFEGVEGWQRDKVCLPTFRAESWGPLVFVNLDARAETLSERMGPITEEIRRHDYPFDGYQFLFKNEYLVNCNWKVYVDNYLEGYHIPTIHPALHRELDYKQYRVDTFRWHSSQFAPLRPLNTAKGPRRYDPAQGAPPPLYYWVFPNLMINVYPDNLHINQVIPLGVDRTLVTFEWFVPPSGQFSTEQATAFSEQVQKEDMAVCESVQRGLAAPSYERGRYSASRENGVHHFHRLLQETIEAT